MGMVPRREQPMLPASALHQCTAWHSALCLCAPVCVCTVVPGPMPSLPIPGFTHQGELTLATLCQGRQLEEEEGQR